MDKKLNYFIEKLNKNEINYWVDNGTLLGLIREGKLLDQDPDFDISVWASDRNKIKGLCEEVPEYKMKYKLYGGELCNIKLIPLEKNKRQIDIKVFKKKDEYAVSPVDVPLKNSYSIYNPIKYFVGVPRHVIHTIYYADNYFAPDISKKICGRNLRHEIMWWVIPQELLDNIKFSSEYKVNLPMNPERLLNYHYGDWQRPNNKWTWYLDDGAIRNTLPKNVEYGSIL